MWRCNRLRAVLQDGYGLGSILWRAFVVEAPAATSLDAINFDQLLALKHFYRVRTTKFVLCTVHLRVIGVDHPGICSWAGPYLILQSFPTSQTVLGILGKITGEWRLEGD